MINEEKLVQHLKAKSSGFIGDDAAVLPPVHHEKYLITKDLLVENVHFRTKYYTPKNLAHKALHVNLSDLAAMGAQPVYILCGISLPKNLHQYAADFLDYLTESCKEAGVILIGGDTTAASEHLFISITAMGKAREDEIKYRNTAKVNDLICVSGNLGFAHLGFITLEQDHRAETEYTDSFLRPEAKIKEGRWLGKQPSVTSMMDISDGLYIDLQRLCEASGKGAIIELALLQQFLEPGISLKIALEGGEDYGLLFTVNPEFFETLSSEFSTIFGDTLKVVGYITEGDHIQFQEGSKNIELLINPFGHF